ncbi:MAG: hypothetical protein CVU39_12935 [Chloroflexi bacterium HGW-Chloroflexi-10]|nr:MAG: hypothetical protein CVU39_12935 [Chloroflexi bacterium HGW-Chloroflexi-10]
MVEIQESELWIISGERLAGKTTLCAALVDGFRARGWKISGVRSPAVFAGGEKVAIDVEDLRSGETRRLAVRANQPQPANPGEKPLQWSFDPTALAWGNEVLAGAVPTDLLIVDELGPLELLRGQGWVNGLDALDSRTYRQAVLVMRPELLENACRRWPWGKVIRVEKVGTVPALAANLLLGWEQ